MPTNCQVPSNTCFISSSNTAGSRKALRCTWKTPSCGRSSTRQSMSKGGVIDASQAVEIHEGGHAVVDEDNFLLRDLPAFAGVHELVLVAPGERVLHGAARLVDHHLPARVRFNLL